METLVAFANLKLEAVRYTTPNVRNYNRLEGSPRSRDFQKNIGMECHDPLWFLCRQWQFGEFQADDAATASQASVLGTHTVPGEMFSADGKKYAIDNRVPIETLVERERLSPTLQLRAQMGRHLLKILKRHRLRKYARLLAADFAISRKIEPDDKEGLFLSAALSSGIPDGYKIHKRMLSGTFKRWFRRHPDVARKDHAALLQCQNEFKRWFRNLYQQPDAKSGAWDPTHLEYSFGLECPHETKGTRHLLADQYPGGHLDWKDFDQQVDRQATVAAKYPKPEDSVQTFIPTQLKFSGMPHTRLWQMEDNEINFGKIDASPTSILNVLVAEYGLNYSNDWFVLPYELPVNTICQVKGILLKDVFGQYIYVKPAIRDPETEWQEFAMFHQSERDNATRDESIFYLSPSIGQRLESEDIERINVIRDEMSNMVWAIEQVVASEAGSGRILKRDVPSIAEFKSVSKTAEVRYVLGNTVPDNWIPFVPVHKPAQVGQDPKEIRLQRARMPQSTGPRGKILSEVQPVYFLEEEEVPRAGVIVSRRFQRTRWLNGKTLLWMGRKKSAGRGEGSANLSFDEIVNIPVT